MGETGKVGAGDADARDELLRLLLAEEGLDAGPATVISRRPPDAEPQLSYAQERMWFLSRLEPESAALNIRVTVRVRGPLDIDALRSAFAAVLERHEILRTVVVDHAGEPRPLVHESPEVPFEVREPADEDELAAALAHDAAQPFDLANELPIRITVHRRDDHDHVVALVVHHIAGDGWSMQILGRELDALYVAHGRGDPSPLPPLPIQYADYTHWQRSTSTQQRHDRQLQYWKDKLARPLPSFEIAPDRARPREHTYSGAAVSRVLDDRSVSGLRSLATRSNATLFMVMLAAFEVVAARHAGEDDVVLGIPVAGRVRPELEPLVGAFLNNLVVRNDVGDDPVFLDLVERVRVVTLEAFDNQDVPFERLLAELNVPRDRSRTPVFQILFNMQEIEPSERSRTFMGHLEHESVPDPEPDSKFDITMYVLVEGGRITLRCVYNCDLYEAATMEELVDQYVQLLDTVADDPNRPISAYSLITSEARRVLPDPTAVLDATWHGSVHDAVRGHAARGAVTAIDDRGHEVSYDQLAGRMNQLAGWLRSHGVERGDVVAIVGHRSAALVCAVLGSLAAGCPYTILDPRYPPGRLAQYVRIGRPAAILHLDEAGTLPDELEQALADVGARARLAVPRDLTAFAALDAWSPTFDGTDPTGPDDPACLTFTSGSTGTPKAVLGKHGSLTHFLPWMSEEFDVGPKDRFSMLSGLAHDPLQRDMFWPLWVGATLVVPDANRMLDPGWLADWLHDRKITVTHLTPAMGRVVAEGVPAAASGSSSLRRAFFIGDVLTRLDVELISRIAPSAKVVNLYGTTETQRASAFHVVTTSHRGPVSERDVLPLGTGMPGTQVTVRTRRGQPAGIGEVGDIWFRSPHLALGYLHDPDETARRFVTDGPADHADHRSYRTGDRGRFTHSGQLEFLGRTDDQVQLRGFRIELEEIRAVLRRCRGVSDVVVARTGDDPASARLVAYVASTEGVHEGDLRRLVEAELPAHMVPSEFVLLDAIPLTPNGKVDRHALRAQVVPRAGAGSRAATGAAPRDDLERTIASIWSTVLGRDVGVDDNFFELGGYSLLGTRMFAMIERATGHRLPVAVLFQHPTVAQLARSIRDDGWRHGWTSLVPIQPLGSERPLFYVAPYMISVLELASLGDELGEDRPLYGFQPQGLDGSAAPHRSIEEMAEHYIAEMKSVQPDGPYAIGGHCSGAWVAFEMARQLERAGERISDLVLVDRGPPGVERPRVHPVSYIVRHAWHYLASGRLHHAVMWKVKVLTARHLLRRVGSPTVRFENAVREAHRAAYGVYRGGRTALPITLILSDDAVTLSDAAWYGRWHEVTDSPVRTYRVTGTHANLLVRPYVQGLAKAIIAATSTVGPGEGSERDQRLTQRWSRFGS